MQLLQPRMFLLISISKKQTENSLRKIHNLIKFKFNKMFLTRKIEKEKLDKEKWEHEVRSFKFSSSTHCV